MKEITMRLISQVLVAGILSLLISSLSVVSPSTTIISALYTVLGVASSLSMSTALSIDLKDVREERARKKLKQDIRILLDNLVCDFCLASIALFLGSIDLQIFTTSISTIALSLNPKVLSFIIISLSLVYNIRNVYAMHKFKMDLEDKVIGNKKS